MLLLLSMVLQYRLKCFLMQTRMFLISTATSFVLLSRAPVINLNLIGFLCILGMPYMFGILSNSGLIDFLSMDAFDVA